MAILHFIDIGTQISTALNWQDDLFSLLAHPAPHKYGPVNTDTAW